jgi:hypothetical protein
VKNSPQGKSVCEYVYTAGKLTISEGLAPEVLPVGPGVVPGGSGVSSGVGSLRWMDGGAPGPLYRQPVCGFFVVPLWQGGQVDVWFCRIIARCHYLAAVTF